MFVGWTAVVVVSLWWTLHLPPSHIAPWFPIQLASIASIPFVVSGLPTWIDPSQQVVVSGAGNGPNVVVTWPRAKGRKRAVIGFMIFVVVTATGWSVNRVVDGPIELDEIAITDETRSWFESKTRDCVRDVWQGESARGVSSCIDRRALVDLR